VSRSSAAAAAAKQATAAPHPPRIIWIYWEQGHESAPDLVKLCTGSWRHHNPGWQIVALDGTNLNEYIDTSQMDLHRSDITVQKRVNLIRLMLLRTHGGVWADGALYCWQPLDSWLPAVFGSGYFTFSAPGPDRLASSWFMAANPDSALLAELAGGFIALFRDHVFSNHGDKATEDLIDELGVYLNRDAQGTLFWTSPRALRYLKAYPYFIFHYYFNRLVLTSPEFRQRWEQVPTISADGPHMLQRLAGEPPERAIVRLWRDPAPVHKLNWRCEPGSPYWGAVLGHLAARLTDSTSA
jgi:hypothetical protein